jgi:hypothetical protein
LKKAREQLAGELAPGKVITEPPLDPWAHRSVKMRCLTCMWFAPKGGVFTAQGEQLGRCRRRAPTMDGYPVVFQIDWCGDHKLDERKA